MKDQRILEEIRSGNPSRSLEELYDSYPRVQTYVLQNSGTEDEAKDIFQEAIVIFYEQALNPDFELSCAAYTYVFAIAKRLWYSKLRKNGKEIRGDFDTTVDVVTPIEEYEEQESMFGYLDEVIQKLGDKCRAILKQYYYLKYSMKQIAENLSYSTVNAAKTQKYKCMERAKKMAADKVSIHQSNTL